MQRFLFLLFLLMLVSQSSWAASHAKRPVTHKKAAVHKTEQVPFSFLPPPIPNATLQRLQTPLTGRIVQQQATRPTSSTSLPKYTPIVLSPVSLESQRPVPEAHHSHSNRHAALHWFHSAQKTHSLPVDYPERSWVELLSVDQAKTLASSMTHTLSQQFSPETTTLLLAIPPKTQRNNPLPSLLNDELRKAGFALVTGHAQAANAQLIQSLASG